jgi:Zn finger protein HypA/HybF involved in hydrogenase expression
VTGVIAPLNRTLDQELVALIRGVSLECLVCGEFVLRTHGAMCCPECGFRLRDQKAQESGLQLDLQAG